MRYRIGQYAEALSEACAGKSEPAQKKIARRFAALLRRHRMSAKTRLILAAYEKIALQKRGERRVRIEAPAPVSEQFRKELRAVLGSNVHFEESVNPELLAGAKILVDDELLIDASAKKQMERMFTKK